MADILGTFYQASKVRVGTSPSSPGVIAGDPVIPVNPPGSNPSHSPVTIGSPANGLSIDGSQVLTIGLASSGVTGALSGTDWDTFNSKLTVAGTQTEGYVATIVSGVPTWAAGGGG